MTVEERAELLWEELVSLDPLPLETILANVHGVIEKHLRDQIEDCAKVADEQAEYFKSEAVRLRRNNPAFLAEEKAMRASRGIANQIRALAGQTEESPMIINMK
jgi:hypothetical protein